MGELRLRDSVPSGSDRMLGVSFVGTTFPCPMTRVTGIPFGEKVIGDDPAVTAATTRLRHTTLSAACAAPKRRCRQLTNLFRALGPYDLNFFKIASLAVCSGSVGFFDVHAVEGIAGHLRPDAVFSEADPPRN